MSRLRLVGWNVQPVVMLDDGENLVPVQVSAQMIPATEWQHFKAGGDELVLDHVRQQIADGGSLPHAPESG
jgi:hypothetical protein